MGKKKDDDDKPSPVKIAVVGGLLIAGVLVGFRLILDALDWWSGGPGTLTARIGVGVIVLLVALLYLRSKLRKKR